MFIRCINLVLKEILCGCRKKNLSQTLFGPKEETVFVFLILYLIKFLFIYFFTKVFKYTYSDSVSDFMIILLGLCINFV